MNDNFNHLNLSSATPEQVAAGLALYVKAAKDNGYVSKSYAKRLDDSVRHLRIRIARGDFDE